MKTLSDLSETERTEYNKILFELSSLEKRIDSHEFKTQIETKKEVISKYLELRKRQNALIPIGRKGRFKDKAIKEVYDYSLSALELKQKSHLAYIRMKNNFNKLFQSKLEKARNK